jgi:outer membrane protein assembly factor BamD
MSVRATRITFRIPLFLILVATLFFLDGCFWKKKVPVEEPSARELYQKGLEMIHKEKYEEAREFFNKVKIASAETDLELLAQIAVADSYFEEEEYEAARAQYEEIFKLHSGGEIADYLQYRIGECFFWQIDTIDRDTTNAKEALDAFNRLVENYPESEYLSRARLRIKEIHTFLAESEFFIGNFYLRKNALFAAINRFKKALELYPDSRIQDKLLFYLYKTYSTLKDEDNTEVYERYLLEEYPNSEYIPMLAVDKTEESRPEREDAVEKASPVHAPRVLVYRPPSGLTGTYQGKDRDSWSRRLFLLQAKAPQDRGPEGTPDAAEEESDLQNRSFLEKIIP